MYFENLILNIKAKDKKSFILGIIQKFNNLLTPLVTHVHDHIHSVTIWQINPSSLL